MNILQSELNCIWAGTLKGFAVKTSEIYQKLEPERHSSVTKLLQTNELDPFIHSGTGTKIMCFQVAICITAVDSINTDQNAILAIQLFS